MLKELFEFSAIKPHSAAVGAVVDLHVLALREDKWRGRAGWTMHLNSLLMNACDFMVKGAF
ncbi:MAG: hypothetical protein V4706_12880 [Pseudomonadota bacterium]